MLRARNPTSATSILKTLKNFKIGLSKNDLPNVPNRQNLLPEIVLESGNRKKFSSRKCVYGKKKTIIKE